MMALLTPRLQPGEPAMQRAEARRIDRPAGREQGEGLHRSEHDADQRAGGRLARQQLAREGRVDRCRRRERREAKAELRSESDSVHPAAVSRQPILVDLPTGQRQAASQRRRVNQHGCRQHAQQRHAPPAGAAGQQRPDQSECGAADGAAANGPDRIRGGGHRPRRPPAPFAERGQAGQHRLTTWRPGRSQRSRGSPRDSPRARTHRSLIADHLARHRGMDRGWDGRR